MGQNTRSTLVNVFDKFYNRDTLRCLRFKFYVHHQYLT